MVHTRKAESQDFVETVQGTFGTAVAADTIVVVKRSAASRDAKLCITGRDVEERELALRFNAAAGTWALLGVTCKWPHMATEQAERARKPLLEGQVW